ncbi:sterol desaturase family protein [Pseudomonas knackmussii]|uniref:sterol desaturase family protein n=1 Tax=Pseudomonas knackmussii TaxID=65741 RepID=UPI003F49DF40
MNDFSQIYHHLSELVIEPVSNQFCGIFDLNGRLGVLFLFISYAVAYGLYRSRKQRGQTDAPSFWKFIGGNRVHFHRSALLDYRYYFVRAILTVAWVVPIAGLVDPYILESGDYIAFFTRLWGERPRTGAGLSLSLLYGLGLFLLNDLRNYWVHRAFHSRWLWAFHKVHHSAPVLVPVTASRIHFVEDIVEKLVTSITVGAYAGVFWYLCGEEVSRYTLFGVTYLVFIFNALASNLRHSHVWLSFGPIIEHVLNSPAQHQVHHSDSPRHFNKNFGTNLSVWDWMFGTLYVTSPTPEHIRFGVGEQHEGRYLTIYSLIAAPFVETIRKLRPAKEPQAAPTEAASTQYS